MATVLDQLYDVAVLLLDLEQMDDDELRAAFAEGFREHPGAVQGMTPDQSADGLLLHIGAMCKLLRDRLNVPWHHMSVTDHADGTKAVIAMSGGPLILGTPRPAKKPAPPSAADAQTDEGAE